MSDRATTELERLVTLQRRVDAAIALHKPFWCDAYRAGCPIDGHEVCEVCDDPFPCATVKALRGEPDASAELAETGLALIDERDHARDVAVHLEQLIAAALAEHPDCPHRLPCCDMARKLREEM